MNSADRVVRNAAYLFSAAIYCSKILNRQIHCRAIWNKCNSIQYLIHIWIRWSLTTKSITWFTSLLLTEWIEPIGLCLIRPDFKLWLSEVASTNYSARVWDSLYTVQRWQVTSMPLHGKKQNPRTHTLTKREDFSFFCYKNGMCSSTVRSHICKTDSFKSWEASWYIMHLCWDTR